MQKALKRSFIVLVAVVTMLFTCVLMPKQKAEASLLGLGGVALGTAVAIGLLCYGIAVSSVDPEEDEYLDMACDMLTEIASSQGISKWDLQSYLTNSTWFYSAMAQVASWFYEQNLVFNETYESLTPAVSMLDGSVSAITGITEDTEIDTKIAINDVTYYLFLSASSGTVRNYYFYLDSSGVLYSICNVTRGIVRTYLYDSTSYYYLAYGDSPYLIKYNGYQYMNHGEYSDYLVDKLKYFGITLTAYSDAAYTVSNFIDSLAGGTVAPSPGISAEFPKGVLTGPADTFDATGSLDSYKLDPMNDVIDFGNVLESTGAESFPDLIGKVNTGEITGADVITGVDAVPYVLTDSETGEIATSDTPIENTRPVALTGDVSIPTDLTAEDTYTPTNTDSDSDSNKKTKFNFPLSQFFPFCLPFDLYDFLTFFAADPVAPVIEIPIGEFFSSVPGVTEETTGYVMKLDLGDENFAKWFQILRILETLGIIVGFVMVSRKLIHGGN